MRIPTQLFLAMAAVVAVMAGALAFWRVQPGEQRGEALAVSVPAASSPAADEVPSIRS